ncbi:hypothetical protein LPJ66_005598 [Kickxella alabastrina]|uniref:Uncharacterized protein n=1 Tax=Kickxella alabastrina TaxID=61397 RepID=A0ACC1IEN5_9FUNG|nr:hypothetical protein LPJ66_005598 [Kickxella alabastrina]
MDQSLFGSQNENNESEIVDWARLDQWLKSLYTPSLPPLLANRTVEMQHYLSQLFHIDACIRNAHSIVHRLQSEATNEYQALANQTSDILSHAGLPSTTSALPHPTASALAELSKTASNLGLSDMHPESFERAIAAATIDGFKRQTLVHNLVEQTETVHRKTKESRERQRLLRKLLEHRKVAAPVEQQKAREWVRNSQVIAAKTREYERRLEELAGMSEERGRVREYAEVKALDGEVGKLGVAVKGRQLALDGYKALPPDISLAYLKLEEAKMALGRLRVECENAVAAAFGSR